MVAWHNTVTVLQCGKKWAWPSKHYLACAACGLLPPRSKNPSYAPEQASSLISGNHKQWNFHRYWLVNNNKYNVSCSHLDLRKLNLIQRLLSQSARRASCSYVPPVGPEATPPPSQLIKLLRATKLYISC